MNKNGSSEIKHDVGNSQCVSISIHAASTKQGNFFFFTQMDKTMELDSRRNINRVIGLAHESKVSLIRKQIHRDETAGYLSLLCHF